jgi:CheY-like chemotaxis protein
MLRSLGHEVCTAHDGVDALAAMEQFRPDVVLLDLGMPRLNGYELARAIRSQPDGEQMLLIAITGWGQDEARRRSREAGCNHHLVKPVDPYALQALLSSSRRALQSS